MTSRRGARFRSWFSPPLCARLQMAIFSVLAAITLFSNPVPKASAAPSSLEYEVKAAFLLNFTKFVEWPPSAFSAADTPLTICIVGTDPFGHVIDQIVEGESVNGHKIAVERLHTLPQKSCQVLYFGVDSSTPASITPSGPAVLTVGEGQAFIHQGGVIAFVIDNRRVRFDINLDAATNAGLKLSSKLLSVAKSVEK